MTTDERKMLTTYRQQGFGYKKIAQLIFMLLLAQCLFVSATAIIGRLPNETERPISAYASLYYHIIWEGCNCGKDGKQWKSTAMKKNIPMLTTN